MGRALQEKIPLKKTTKRLGQHLRITGLWLKILDRVLDTQRSYLRQCRYMVIDLSDIQKRYAEQMWGLAEVYDGSEQTTGSGYWLCNVTGVDSSSVLIVSAHSELYSLAEENSSDNKKLLSVIERVSDVVSNYSIWVDDRGGDRKSLMNPLVGAGRQFIIRQVGNRDLYFNGSKQPLKAISRAVKLTTTYQVTKTMNNKKVRETYHCGAEKVKLTENGKDIWLVVLKEQRRGYCLLLCHLNETCKDAGRSVLHL